MVVMFRLFVILAVLFGASLYYPPTREPVLDFLRPALNPGFAWASRGEMQQIVRDLQDVERAGRSLPTARGEFEQWMSNRYQLFESTVDSWGSPYRLELRGQNIRVISAGPDLEFGTPDDLVVEGPRAERRRR
jgi:hypothetical protein